MRQVNKEQVGYNTELKISQQERLADETEEHREVRLQRDAEQPSNSTQFL